MPKHKIKNVIRFSREGVDWSKVKDGDGLVGDPGTGLILYMGDCADEGDGTKDPVPMWVGSRWTADKTIAEADALTLSGRGLPITHMGFSTHVAVIDSATRTVRPVASAMTGLPVDPRGFEAVSESRPMAPVAIGKVLNIKAYKKRKGI